MARYHIAIVEDDADAAATLRGHVERWAREHGEELAVTWLGTAVELVSGGRGFDLVFLDIGLPGLSGMEAAALIRSYDEETPLIFVTDLAQYALEGYEVGALDFMVKPVTYGSLALRMDRAMRIVRRRRGQEVSIGTRANPAVVPAGAIVWVELQGHDLVWHLEGAEPVRRRGSLHEAEELVVGAPFVRVSNSCLANMDHVRMVLGSTLRMSDGSEHEMSRARRKDALDALARYFGDGGGS